MFKEFYETLPENQRELLIWLMNEFVEDFCPANLAKIDKRFYKAKEQIDIINKRRAFLQTRLSAAESLFKHVDAFLKKAKGEKRYLLILLLTHLHFYKKEIGEEFEASRPQELLAEKQSCRVSKEERYLRNLLATEVAETVLPQKIEERLKKLKKIKVEFKEKKPEQKVVVSEKKKEKVKEPKVEKKKAMLEEPTKPSPKPGEAKSEEPTKPEETKPEESAKLEPSKSGVAAPDKPIAVT